MKMRSIGIFDYIDSLSDEKQIKLPITLQLGTATNEAILLRLLLGQLKLRKKNGLVIKPNMNYISLPMQPYGVFTYKSISDIFDNAGSKADILKDAALFDGYFNKNRKNHNVHKAILFEISNYYVAEQKSSINAFVHLYRCLEYMSYTFPMVYAAKSKDYTGTFNDLKKFFSGDSKSGELSFFRKFMEALFNDEETTLKFQFDINLNLSYPVDTLVNECKKVYADKVMYNIDNSVLSIPFSQMLSLFIETRNRYFHFLVGQGQNNFSSIDYDIGEYFASINPFLLNWMSIIIQKIAVYGFYSSLPGS